MNSPSPSRGYPRIPAILRSRHSLAAWVATGGVLLSFASPAPAEDSPDFRTYLQLRSGDVAPLWGVDDHWGITFGANLNRHWGVELATDLFEKTFEPDAFGTLGEVSSSTFAPLVRFRVPFLRDRLVPYAIAGAGGSFLQFNDRTLEGFGRAIDAEGTRLALIAGGGIDFFFADNLAFNLEGRYTWIDSLETTVDGQSVDLDMSAVMATFGLRIFFSENDPQPLVTPYDSDVNRFYFGMRFGGTVMTDDQWGEGIRLENEAQAIGAFNQVAGLSVGADFGKGWGAEVVVAGTEWVPVVDGLGGVAEYAVVSILPTLRYRLPFETGRWSPYLLAGGGATYHEINDSRRPGEQVKIREARGFSPAVAVGGGVEYFFARNVAIGGELRWQYSWDHTIQVNDGPVVSGDLSDLQLAASLRIYLFEWGKE